MVSLAFINSILEILAMVFLLPSCFANAHTVILTASSEVTAIKRSELAT